MLHTMPAVDRRLTSFSLRVALFARPLLSGCSRDGVFSRHGHACEVEILRRLVTVWRCGCRVRVMDRQDTAFGGSRMPSVAIVCVAVMHSLWTASAEAIFKPVCMVCMCETMCDGPERV